MQGNTDRTPQSGQDSAPVLHAIQISLARQDQMLANLIEGQQEMKGDQKEFKNDQRDFRKEFAVLATMVNTVQGQIGALQAQLSNIQAQVNGLLSWQLSITQQRGIDVVATNDRIYDPKTTSQTSVTQLSKSADVRTIATQATALMAIVGVLIWLVQQFLAPHLH